MKNLLCTILLLFFSTNQLNAQQVTSCFADGCHGDLISKKNIHPIVSDDCFNCHEGEESSHPIKQGSEFTLPEESPSLCYTCHDDLITTEITKSVHPPFEEDCLDCHNPHSSDNDNLMEETVPDLCYFCHDDPNELENVSSIHNAINLEKKCMNCHSPHSSTHYSLLLQEEIILCLSCHNKKIKSDDKIIENISKKIEVEEEAHPPVVMDGCSTCHNPHSSQSGSLLLDKFPTGNYASGFEDNYSLCFTCHDEEAFTEEVTNEDTEFRNGSTNLHFVHVNKDKSRSCANCHDVHGSKNEHLISEEMSFGKIKMKLNFRVTETGGSCSPGCHNQKNYKR